MQACSKLCIRFLSGLVRNDMRTISRIAVDCKIGKELITPVDVRKLCYFPPPSGEEWRIPLLLELLEAREGRSDIPGVHAAEIDFMIGQVCTD